MSKFYICKKCGGKKEIVGFRKDGHKDVRCRRCTNEYCKEYRRKNKGKSREYYESYSKTRKSKTYLSKIIREMLDKFKKQGFFQTQELRIQPKDKMYELIKTGSEDKEIISQKKLLIILTKELEEYVRKRGDREFYTSDERSRQRRTTYSS